MSVNEIGDLIDGYLLGRNADRGRVFAKVAAWKSDLPAAAPLLRALTMLGARAADESLIALRLIIAGKAATDEAVLQLRTSSREMKAGDQSAEHRYRAGLSAS